MLTATSVQILMLEVALLVIQGMRRPMVTAPSSSAVLTTVRLATLLLCAKHAMTSML